MHSAVGRELTVRTAADCPFTKGRNNSKMTVYIKFLEVQDMKKFICTVCGYIHEGEEPPEICPICKASSAKFKEVTDEE